VKFHQAARLTALSSAALISALALTACGSDTNAGAASTSGSTGASSAASLDCGSGAIKLNAEGSSAQKNAIDQVIASFGKACPDVTVNYNPTGSGAGIKSFNGGLVQFAGSDSALSADKGEVAAAKARCTGNDAWNLPMVTGPIAVAYNLDGVKGLVLNADVTAKIFRGVIKTWNDPAIVALNPKATLPSEAIHVFFRSDESGTTDNFTKYMNTAAPSVWTDKNAKAWPAGGTGEGREKSSGVSEGVKTTPGGITYAEWSYAKDNALGIAQIDNGSGPVELTADSAGKAVATATRAGQGNDLALKLDYATKAPGAYPIVLVTYEIVCSKGLDANETKAVKAFLTHFASADVQTGLVGIGYAPLPTAVSADVAKAIAAIA
jgi:phosphate transport system substrate-binding protein